jgi:superfamily II DNA or RNA helicase
MVISTPGFHGQSHFSKRSFSLENLKKLSKKENKSKKPKSLRKQEKPSSVTASPERLEFHRFAAALIPDGSDLHPGVAFFVEPGPGRAFQSFCTCRLAGRTCRHMMDLSATLGIVRDGLDGKSPEDDFKSGIWHRLAETLAEGFPDGVRSVRVDVFSANGGGVVLVSDRNGDPLVDYLSPGPDASRFVQRISFRKDKNSVPLRGDTIEELGRLTLSHNEWTLCDRGYKSRRQVLEESFWYRVAYHGYRELGNDGFHFQPAIDETSGAFAVTCRQDSGALLFRMVIPRARVKRTLEALGTFQENSHGLSVHPVPIQALFKLTPREDLDLDLRPVLKWIRQTGEEEFLERDDLEKFTYGNLVYIPELGVLAELKAPQARSGNPMRLESRVLKQAQVGAFLQEHGKACEGGAILLDSENRNLRIFSAADRVSIDPEAMDRDWCWMSVIYGFGDSEVSLAEILRARAEGEQFIATSEGWVDCWSEEMEKLEALSGLDLEQAFDGEKDRFRFSRLELFRLKAAVGGELGVAGRHESSELIRRMLDLKPQVPMPVIPAMASSLRGYQERGTEWLWFLNQNGFGGLLCDDMGLGKTHQVMALMLLLQQKGLSPFLVVCPTTVISHWEAKLRTHTPGLAAAVYHGGGRNLKETLNGNAVVITSYGILWRDMEALKQANFSLAVFDEIQNLKNRETHAHAAAREIPAGMKLGLTGTPVENSLKDLKALLDLAVPGYLGSDERFTERFVNPIEADLHHPRRKELIRLIHPFTLRRMKKTVLAELPEKIEDTRTCRLSEDQVKLYREAVSSRGAGLLESLRKNAGPIPYIHIFALLTLLKQICDHPALLEKSTEGYERLASGKWDLFSELLSESLESGQKIVVYSQFLKMIEIVEAHLSRQGIGHVSLTGKSRDRGKIISRFNEDPDCRVFVGSLKAGGVGIDLVAASVVIHYDRWWNAAREDQATDRVHRIGQKRGVQVFKLVTEGTLEEKISAIIERKRNLMDQIVREDDPGLLKVFSREELIEILTLRKIGS